MREMMKRSSDGRSPALPDDVASLVDAPSSLEGEAALSALNVSMDALVCPHKLNISSFTLNC